MGNKRFNIWIGDEELEVIRKKAKKDNRSVSNFMKCQALKEEKDK